MQIGRTKLRIKVSSYSCLSDKAGDAFYIYIYISKKGEIANC